ncbi:MAG: hypothetical protein J7519_15355 [Roseofilum sp. SID1]|uniref:hypothetical protein n=1 Tax=Roseofilum sp. SID1 TaxID=2821497 RepID=UPI001B0B2FE6|nr:hypothetical protein [Roseofilum sp. SID1]MBP0039061.1 hypothetical protein [Roseofilum sp. SID1]
MPPVPIYLIAFTTILVIVPSIIAILWRIALHGHLTIQTRQVQQLIHWHSIGKPRIVAHLEQRYAEANARLEHVNTGALIDNIYSQQRILLLSCEQIEYMGKILPNLLLSVGLLGTFIGITVNLTSLSNTVRNTTAVDINSFAQALQQPLQGMGIAFVSSLISILFSAVLTVANGIFNIAIARKKFVNVLEDYLDNVYLQTLPIATGLDSVIQVIKTSTLQITTGFDRVLEEINTSNKVLINHFGQIISASIERALKEKVQELTDENRRAVELAKTVYSQLTKSTLDISENTRKFQQSVDSFRTVATQLDKSPFPQSLSSATAKLAKLQRGFEESIQSLTNSVQTIEISVSEFRSFSKRMENFGDQLNQSQAMSLQALQHQQKSQESMEDLISRLFDASKGLKQAVDAIDNLQRRTTTKAEDLDDLQSDLKEAVGAINRVADTVEERIEKIGDRQNISNNLT